jgi:hypothetical protein
MLWPIACLLLCACGGDDDDTGAISGSGGAATSTGSGGGGEPTTGSGGRAQNVGGGSGGRSSSMGSGGQSSGSGGSDAGNTGGNPGPIGKAGNPDGKCSEALPDEAKPADVSNPTTVVGDGSAASCTFDKLNAAIMQGGVITFDCGDDAVTIDVTATLELPTDRNTVIDGGNKVTLDGGGKVRIMKWDSPDWLNNDNTLTLQHLVMQNGKATPTEMIPERPEPCSQGYNDGEGGALYMRDGALRAIDVTFLNNSAAELGPDTGGGAVYMLGSKPAYIASCTFKGNKASNAGAIGSLFCTDFIYDSLFEDNEAVGHGANNNDPSMCEFMNNDQNEIGSGGNGGAIYSDGVAMDITICGTQVRGNKSGAFGAAVFFTSNDQSNKGTLSIRDSVMFDNIPKEMVWEWKPGISTNADTPEPVDSDIRR